MNGKAEHKRTDAIKVSHNMASMLDVTPSYPVVRINREYDKNNMDRLKGNIFFSVLIFAISVLFEIFAAFQIEHTTGHAKIFGILMFFGALVPIAMAVIFFIKNINKLQCIGKS